ncbi:MAG TPA: hypothetical protein K8U70_00870 [Facklamia tabacinasalis]|nr:hypothetical protein [Ruoffia tabacinasalis]
MSHALPNIGKVATNALQTIDVTQLEEVADFSKDELLKLHGMGQKSINILESALTDIDLTFSDAEPHPYKPDFLVLGDLSCNNAPKRRVIRDFVVGLFVGKQSNLEETLNPAVETEINGDQTINGIDELITYFDKKDIQLSSLNLLSILSHGKYGAADGVIIAKSGQRIHFASFYTFENTKKEALIKAIRFYMIEEVE